MACSCFICVNYYSLTNGTSYAHTFWWKGGEKKKMNSLYTSLTDAQKAGLSKEDQALYELGVIGGNLELLESLRCVQLLLKMNRAELGTFAIKEVARIKAEIKKQREENK